VEHEFISVRRDRLLAGSALISAEQRATFFATLFVGLDGLSHAAADTNSAITFDDDLEKPTSFALSIDQARELKSKIDEATWTVVKATVANSKDDVGTIEWSEVKRMTGVTNWPQFAKGRMGGLHRSLRKIGGVPKDAVLFWEGEVWVEDGQGDYSAGTIGIDGPAVRTLRTLCGLNDGS
jgi:hypothetical protein